MGSASGAVAGFAALAVAELVSAAVRPEASPVTVVGGAAVDRTPPELKDFAVRHFGTEDKAVLQLGIVVVLALFAFAVGALAVRHRRIGAVVALLFGVVGVAAAVTRPDARPSDVLPSAVGGVVAGCLLYWLVGRVPGVPASTAVGAGKAASLSGGGGAAGTTAYGDRSGRAPRGASRSTPEHGNDAGRTSAGGLPGPTGAPLASGKAASGKAASGKAESGKSEPGKVASGTAEAETVEPGRVEPRAAEPEGAESGVIGRGAFDRRGFVVAATAAAAVSAGAGALGRHLNADKLAAEAADRADIVLPRPVSTARPVPAEAHPNVAGLSPFVTANKDFYRVDTALAVPHVDAGAWRLRLHGKGVRRPVTFTFQDLLRRDLIERHITLTCVSNQVGGPYVGNARWIGVRLADVLKEAGVRPPSQGGPADQLVARSVDGMTIGSPVETVMDGRDALLAVGMNGEPLPFAHGFPVRMVVPGLYGYVSACKWLTDLELTTFDDFDAYWVKRTWSREAPIKTESRIDTPRPFASPKAGVVPVAGVAWAQHRGIARVEVRVDGGAWHDAELGAEDTSDTWRQWVWPWKAASGSHTLEVRATDRTGHTQTEHRVGTVPNGATGWHSVVVAVT
ncbi:molybdopterin-dependent oxidoreductase [Streptomyces fuscigenes]|uniref:molybdopterin-dependent oxidoreductase n=1 Tax=Streptomyces fuscigenes TaxID=1528880 RepID=UPI001F3D7343|nr:molybdopterin-dependent oxidoreductase [Streptomyces fuscigenes]MCF3960556.1 molybdopterin-dependent oxidoreductase [Streptomyces fuscigenes]